MKKKLKGVQIAAIRKSLGMTQEEFAAALGVSFVTVSRWENDKGGISRMGLANLERIISEHGASDLRALYESINKL